MKAFRSVIFPGILGLAVIGVATEIPHTITYQGRVTANGVPFTGLGQFKFCLISPGTSVNAQATGIAAVVNGFVVGISVTAPGAGYATPPKLQIIDATGNGAIARANLINGTVASITVLNAGAGYSAPLVLIDPPPGQIVYMSYWSNDGTSAGGEEPTTSVVINVGQGMFTAGLGDTNHQNMVHLPPTVLTVFTNHDVRIRIWFDNGIHGFHQLIPDQPITAIPYALIAASVPDGSINSEKLAPGSVGNVHLANGAISASKLASNTVAATPSGSIVLSQDGNASNLLATGYIRMPGVKLITDEWEVLLAKTPVDRWESIPAGVFTGSELVLWGDRLRRIGARYLVGQGLWKTMTTNGAPVPRQQASAVWTGGRALFWGGFNCCEAPIGNVMTGGSYDPGNDAWSEIATNDAPSGRFGHVAVWTGTEMLVWGGLEWTGAAPNYLNTGGRYDLALNRWRPIATNNAPSPRKDAFAAWTGTEMIVWGGLEQDTSPQNTGGRYRPSTDVWLPMNRMMSSSGLDITPSLYSGVAVWTGTELVVWSDQSGGRYNPQTDTWTPMNPAGLLGAQLAAVAGNEIMYLNSAPLPSAKYQLLTDTWSTFLVANIGWVPAQLFKGWNGASLFLWDTDRPDRTLKYTPTPPLFLYQKP